MAKRVRKFADGGSVGDKFDMNWSDTDERVASLKAKNKRSTERGDSVTRGEHHKRLNKAGLAAESSRFEMEEEEDADPSKFASNTVRRTNYTKDNGDPSQNASWRREGKGPVKRYAKGGLVKAKAKKPQSKKKR